MIHTAGEEEGYFTMLAPVTVAVICPLLMATLGQQPGTRLLRLGLFPIGMIAAVWAVLEVGHRTAARKQHIGEQSSLNTDLWGWDWPQLTRTDTDDSFLAIFLNQIVS